MDYDHHHGDHDHGDHDPPLPKYPIPAQQVRRFSDVQIIVPDIDCRVYKDPRDRIPLPANVYRLQTLVDTSASHAGGNFDSPHIHCALCLGDGGIRQCSMCLESWHVSCCVSVRETWHRVLSTTTTAAGLTEAFDMVGIMPFGCIKTRGAYFATRS